MTGEGYVPILRPRWCPLRRDSISCGNGVAAPVSVTPEVGEFALTDARAMPEFSRLVQVDMAGTKGNAVTITANGEECAAVAERLDLQAVSDLRAEASMRPAAAGLVRLNVDFSANVVQSCVVTLDAVMASVADRFSVLCEAEKRGGKADDADGEVFVDPFGEDPVESLVDGGIDLGELVIQHLSLALDPYPHAPGIDTGAVMEDARTRPGEHDVSLDLLAGKAGPDDDIGADFGADLGAGAEAGAEKANPFAKLKTWRNGGPSGGRGEGGAGGGTA